MRLNGLSAWAGDSPQNGIVTITDGAFIGGGNMLTPSIIDKALNPQNVSNLGGKAQDILLTPSIVGNAPVLAKSSVIGTPAGVPVTTFDVAKIAIPVSIMIMFKLYEIYERRKGDK